MSSAQVEAAIGQPREVSACLGKDNLLAMLGTSSFPSWRGRGPWPAHAQKVTWYLVGGDYGFWLLFDSGDRLVAIIAANS
jgi:hypothetical protein